MELFFMDNYQSIKRDFLNKIKNSFDYALHKELDEKLKNDKDIIKEFAKQTVEALAYASEELNNNHSFVVEIMKINGGCLTYAVDEFKKDKEIVLEAIKNGGTIYCADPILKKDREFSLIAIKNGEDIRNIDPAFYDDEEILNESEKKNKCSKYWAIGYWEGLHSDDDNGQR